MADSAAPYYYGKYLWQRVLILPVFWLIVAFTSLDYLEHTMLQVSRKQNAVLVAWLTLIVGEYQLLLKSKIPKILRIIYVTFTTQSPLSSASL